MSVRIEKGIYTFLIFINMTFLLRVFQRCYRIEGMQYGTTTGLFIVGILLFLFYSIVLRKRKYKIGFTLLLCFAAGVFYYYKWAYVQDVFMRYYVNDLVILSDSIYNWKTTDFTICLPFLLILIPIVTVLYQYLTYKGFYNFMVIVNTALLILYWYGRYTEDIKAVIPIYIFLTLFTYGVTKHLKNLRILRQRGVRILVDHKKIGIGIIVLAFIIMKVNGILPQEYKGNYNSETVGKFVNKFSSEKRDEKQNFEKKRYDLVSSGYSNNDKKIGGPLQLNDDLVLKVKSDKPYYLRGNVKYEYNGFGWENGEKRYEKQGTGPLLEEDVFQQLGMEEKTLEIYPVEFETSTLFSPPFTRQVNTEKGQVYVDYFGFTFQNSTVNTKPYSLKYMAAGEDLSIFSKLKENRSVQYKMNFPFSVDENYRRAMQISSEVNLDEISKLASKITKGSYTNYEKVEKIQKYLSDNYSYSLDVEVIPEGEEFLQHFLFKEKKGYCTYFATATTMLCRMVGVPARYVEGFKMSEEKNEKGLYKVTNEDAHAWTEVCVIPESNFWAIVDPSPTPTEEKKREEEKRKKEEIANKDNEKTINVRNKNKVLQQQGEEISPTNRNVILSTKIKTIMALCAGFLLYILIRIGFVIKEKHKILNSTKRIPIYLYTMNRLKKIKIEKPEAIGDKEFLKTISNQDLRLKLEELIPLVYEEFYGNTISDKAFNKKMQYKFIEKHMKQQQGKIKYYLKRYLLW